MVSTATIRLSWRCPLAIAVLASYTALDLGGRVRAAASGLGWAWLLGAALAMGGRHLVDALRWMLAFEMGLPAAYDLGPHPPVPAHRHWDDRRGLGLGRPSAGRSLGTSSSRVP